MLIKLSSLRQTTLAVVHGRNNTDKIISEPIFRLRDLPLELILKIATFLPLRTVLALALTCHDYYELCSLILPGFGTAVFRKNEGLYKLGLEVPINVQEAEGEQLVITKLIIATRQSYFCPKESLTKDFKLVTAGLLALRELTFGNNIVLVDALNAICRLVGDRLEKLKITFLCNDQGPLERPVLSWPVLKSLDITCARAPDHGGTSSILDPTRLRGFPKLQRLTIRCTPSIGSLDDMFFISTFEHLEYLAIRCSNHQHKNCEWTPDGLNLLNSFLWRHQWKLKSLELPSWKVTRISTPMADTANIIETLGLVPLTDLTLSYNMSPPQAWTEMPLPSLNNLRITDFSIPDNVPAWINAPNLRKLSLTLIDMEEVDLKPLASVYPSLQELFIDASDAYYAPELPELLIEQLKHLRLASVCLPRPRGSDDGKVLRTHIIRDQENRIVRMFKLKMPHSSFIVN